MQIQVLRTVCPFIIADLARGYYKKIWQQRHKNPGLPRGRPGANYLWLFLRFSFLRMTLVGLKVSTMLEGIIIVVFSLLYIGGSPEWLIGTVVYGSQRVTYYHRQLQQSIPHFTVFSQAGSPFLVGPDKSQEPGKTWKSRHLQVPACCLTKNSYRSIR